MMLICQELEDDRRQADLNPFAGLILKISMECLTVATISRRMMIRFGF